MISKALWVFGLASAGIALGAVYFWVDMFCTRVYDDDRFDEAWERAWATE